MTEDKIKVVLHDGGIMPTRAHADDAGLDLYTPEDFTINEHSYVKVDLQLSIAIPKDCVGRVCSKSGLMSRGITVMGGEIDCGYTGSISVCLRNENDYYVRFERGNKVAQLIIEPVVICDIEQVESLEETERGDGGFGSTGV